MKDKNGMNISWRAALGLLALVALVATGIAYLVYGTRGSAFRVAGTAATLAIIIYLVSGGLKQLDFFRSRIFQKGSASTVYTVAVIAILVVVNALAAQANMRWDVTAEGMFTLSDQTLTVLEQLDQEVDIMCFFPEGSAVTDEVASLLEEYQYHSPKVDVRFVDPDSEPALARQYDVTRPYTAVIESGGQRRTVNARNLYDFSQIESGQSEDIHFRGEQAFTRTILQLTQNIEANIYFVTGHGEAGLYDEYAVLRGYVEGEGYEVDEWNIGRDGPVPEDADVVVVAGPDRDLHHQEIEYLREFVENDGKLLILAGAAPGEDERFQNLDGLTEHFGVRMRADAVADPERAYYMDALSPVPRMDYHPVTSKLVDGELLVVLPLSRSMHDIEGYDGEYQPERILFSSPQAWSQTDLSSSEPPSPDEQGVLAMGYAVTKAREEVDDEADDPENEPVAVMIGSSAFLESDLFHFQGNSDLFIGSLQWLLDRPELISVGPKRPVPRQVFLSPDEGRLIFYGSTLGMPFAILLIGTVVWMRRRHL
ncbi:MAG: GldG family protein [Clostridia bacterium]